MLRTHTNGELNKKNIDNTVKLCGWVNSLRNHGGVFFINLKDRYGITQIVVDPDSDAHKIAEGLKRDFVIQVQGNVVARKEGMENKKIPTGEIEVKADNIVVLNACKQLPFDPENVETTTEDIRLEYRYVDLRRDEMQHMIKTRAAIVTAIRKFLDARGFLEVETPYLIRSTPEGAKDYIVPSSTHHGKAYSLPQSPQLYKQLLMVSGVDKYYQIARCFRDEDCRSDRQPEFTQLDLEMSFVEVDDIIKLGNELYTEVFKSIGRPLDPNIEVIPYEECMRRWGTDKPDIRFGLEFIDATDVSRKSDFAVFKSVIDEGGVVKCVNAKGKASEFSRKKIDQLTLFAKNAGANGLAWIKFEDGAFSGPIAKFFTDDLADELKKVVDAQNGDIIFFVSDTLKRTNNFLNQIRKKLGRDLNLCDPKQLKALWVVDFPLFEMSDDGNIEACHHLFSMPKAEHIELLESDPLKVQGTLYDFVINGYEIHSGSIRVHDPKIQQRIFNVVGLDIEEARKKFGFLLDAFEYGAPPHGGFAPGIERLTMLALMTDNIKDVVAFPKNKNKESPMDKCPSRIEDEALVDLGLELSDATKKLFKGK